MGSDSISLSIDSNPNQYVFESHNGNERTGQSFYGKRFKHLRVKADAYVSLAGFIACKVVALVSRIFGQEATSAWYNERSFYYKERMQRKVTYLMFGDKVVNFAINGTSTPRRVFEEGVIPMEQLKTIYGENFETAYHAANSERFPIDQEKLSQHPIDEGICFGESLDFIGRYLKDDTEDRFEVIQTVSQQFVEGGTREAQITQILHGGQDRVSYAQSRAEVDVIEMQKQVSKKFGKDFEKTVRKLENLKQMKKDIEDSFQNGGEVENSFLQINKEIEDLEPMEKEMWREFDKLSVSISGKIVNVARQNLANLHGLDLSLVKTIFPEDFEENRNRIAEDVLELSEGAYLLIAADKGGREGKHAIAFIKTAEHGFYIFDPNFATVKYENEEAFALDLSCLIRVFYSTDQKCLINIFQGTLQAYVDLETAHRYWSAE